MRKQTFAAMLAISVLAASNVSLVNAQQGSASSDTAARSGVMSTTPIHSEPMVALERAAQRLRESIQALAQESPGSQREQAMSNARRALYDTQQAMIQLPPEYRVSGLVMSNVPVTRTGPVQNRHFDDSMKELDFAADRLRQAIQAMADQPPGPRRNDAIKQAHEALLETQAAMAWVPGYPSRASAASDGSDGAPASSRTAGQGSIGHQPGSGSVSGRIAAGSDASEIGADVPASSGGVGLNARAMLSGEAAPEHNVKMVFALNTGNYLADVAVNLKDANGRTVIDGISDGPWLYAKLPPGNYTATATYNGQTVTRQFSVGPSGQRLAHFRWPASVEQTAMAGVSPILGSGPQEAR